MPAQCVAPCLQWAAGEKMYHFRRRPSSSSARARSSARCAFRRRDARDRAAMAGRARGWPRLQTTRSQRVSLTAVRRVTCHIRIIIIPQCSLACFNDQRNRHAQNRCHYDTISFSQLGQCLRSKRNRRDTIWHVRDDVWDAIRSSRRCCCHATRQTSSGHGSCSGTSSTTAVAAAAGAEATTTSAPPPPPPRAPTPTDCSPTRSRRRSRSRRCTRREDGGG